MRALCWHGPGDVRVERVPDPTILNPRDIVLRVTSTAICGSDLHLYGGLVPSMQRGDILGHEFMGEVVAAGRESGLRVGERVAVPFAIACGGCLFCRRGQFSLCDNTNPNASAMEAMYGYAGGGLFGYTHLYGGYAGGQAEYVRVPHANVGALRIPESLEDEQALFLTDILPTAWMAAENGQIEPGDVVAIWGCGPVGLLAIRCAWAMGAGRVIAIDRFPDRLEKARDLAGAETIDYPGEDVVEILRDRTGGRGPDVCIDAVGMEAHGTSLDARFDRVAQRLRLEADRSHVLRQVLQACGKGGRVSLPGVYIGWVDRVPMGAAFAKGLRLRMGQTHVHGFMRKLLDLILREELDASFVISHRLPLERGPDAYRNFQQKRPGWIKVVLKPTWSSPSPERARSGRRAVGEPAMA